jgi:hypothetical protein
MGMPGSVLQGIESVVAVPGLDGLEMSRAAYLEKVASVQQQRSGAVPEGVPINENYDLVDARVVPTGQGEAAANDPNRLQAIAGALTEVIVDMGAGGVRSWRGYDSVLIAPTEIPKRRVLGLWQRKPMVRLSALAISRVE